MIVYLSVQTVLCVCEIAQQTSVAGNHPNQCQSQRKTFWNHSPVHLQNFASATCFLLFSSRVMTPFAHHTFPWQQQTSQYGFFFLFSLSFFLLLFFFLVVFLCRIVSLLLNLRRDSPVKEKSKPTFLVKTKEEAPPCTIKIKSTACQSMPNAPCPILSQPQTRSLTKASRVHRSPIPHFGPLIVFSCLCTLWAVSFTTMPVCPSSRFEIKYPICMWRLSSNDVGFSYTPITDAVVTLGFPTLPLQTRGQRWRWVFLHSHYRRVSSNDVWFPYTPIIDAWDVMMFGFPTVPLQRREQWFTIVS